MQAHKLKNDQTKITQVISKLASRRRLLLSATPLQVRFSWPAYNVLAPFIQLLNCNPEAVTLPPSNVFERPGYTECDLSLVLHWPPLPACCAASLRCHRSAPILLPKVEQHLLRDVSTRCCQRCGLVRPRLLAVPHFLAAAMQLRSLC